MRLARLLLFVCTAACSTTPAADDPWGEGGKADGWSSERSVDVVLTEPFCDVCTAADKTLLQASSPITAKIVALIDGADSSLDIANYTFSVRAIEEAILRAKQRGVTITKI